MFAIFAHLCNLNTSGSDKMKPRFHFSMDYIYLWLSCPRDLRFKSNLFQFTFSFSDTGTAFISAVEEHMPQLSVVFDHHQIPTLTNKGFESLRRVKQFRLDKEGEKILQSGSQNRGVCGSQSKVLVEDRHHPWRLRQRAPESMRSRQWSSRVPKLTTVWLPHLTDFKPAVICRWLVVAF
jgi:hypothetical protein